MSEEPINLEADEPELFGMAIREVKTNYKLLRRIVGVKLGFEQVYDDVQLSQMVDISKTLVEHSNSLLEKINAMMNSLDTKIHLTQNLIDQAKRDNIPIWAKIGYLAVGGVAFLLGLNL